MQRILDNAVSSLIAEALAREIHAPLKTPLRLLPPLHDPTPVRVARLPRNATN
jgi:hypothetical protein